MEFRPCGDCTACCDGFLIGNAYGNHFGFGKPCNFLVEKKCTIYKDRPQSCHNYQCGWTQGILPEWMKPTECGVMVSVEINKEEQKQFLRVIELKELVSFEVYREIDKFCKENDTYYVKVPYEQTTNNHS
jgi:Fe-S-cluster containining protein